MRFIAATNKSTLKRTLTRDRKLGSWLSQKVNDGIAKRFWLDAEMRGALRRYESIPTIRKTEAALDVSTQPIQVPLGASMTDSIASAVYDLIFNASPVLSCRGSPGYDNHAYAFQLLSNKLLEDEFVNLTAAANENIIDTVMLGTGVYYVTSAKEELKRATYTELKMGPRVYCAPPEDIVVPGGTQPDVNDMQFIAYRNYFFESELLNAAQSNGWNVEKFKVAGEVDWVRQRRVEASRTDLDMQTVGGIFETFYVYCQYDYDEDGKAEDLFVFWDRTSFSVGHVAYAPYDCSPFVISRYQQRPHIFNGIGVMTMSEPFETEVTEWHNFKMDNAHLANMRFWAYKLGAAGLGEEFKINPRKAQGFGDPSKDIVGLQLADMYPSAQAYEAATIALCEMRVGTPAANSANKQGIAAGKRVPAQTAAAVTQQQNRRFTAPFDNIRRAFASAATQCLSRMRENYLKGGAWKKRTAEYITYVVGVRMAALIFEVFEKSETVDMRDKMFIETTANAASVNRQMDRQNAVERVQVLGAYYDKAVQIGMAIFDPKTPPELKQLLIGVSNAMSQAIRSFLRSFDDIRDADSFIPGPLKAIEDATTGQGNNDKQAAGSPPPGDTSQGQSGAEASASGVDASSDAGTVSPSVGSAELGGGRESTGVDG